MILLCINYQKHKVHFCLMVLFEDCFGLNCICIYFRQLCHLLNAEDIFQSFSKILVEEDDLDFAKKMVQTLNTILLTSTELFGLRIQLKNLNSQVRLLFIFTEQILSLKGSYMSEDLRLGYISQV